MSGVREVERGHGEEMEDKESGPRGESAMGNTLQTEMPTSLQSLRKDFEFHSQRKGLPQMVVSKGRGAVRSVRQLPNLTSF